MTNEDKNLKICDALRWTEIKKKTLINLFPSGIHPKTGEFDLLPNHFTDLNACHEALLSQCDPQFIEEFEANLWSVMGNVGWLTTASASQFAEAFGLTRGLWTKEDSHA